MHEQTNGGIGDMCAEKLRHEQQVVIMHPDEITGLVNVEDCTGESGVGSLVGGPVGVGTEGRRVLGWRYVLPEKIMEEWPQSCKVRPSAMPLPSSHKSVRCPVKYATGGMLDKHVIASDAPPTRIRHPHLARIIWATGHITGSTDRFRKRRTLFAVAVVVSVSNLIVEPDGNITDVLALLGTVARSVLIEKPLELLAVFLFYRSRRDFAGCRVKRTIGIRRCGRRLDIACPADEDLLVCNRERVDPADHCRVAVAHVE